jgi:hypothetical protein
MIRFPIRRGGVSPGAVAFIILGGGEAGIPYYRNTGHRQAVNSHFLSLLLKPEKFMRVPSPGPVRGTVVQGG